MLLTSRGRQVPASPRVITVDVVERTRHTGGDSNTNLARKVLGSLAIHQHLVQRSVFTKLIYETQLLCSVGTGASETEKTNAAGMIKATKHVNFTADACQGSAMLRLISPPARRGLEMFDCDVNPCLVLSILNDALVHVVNALSPSFFSSLKL